MSPDAGLEFRAGARVAECDPDVSRVHIAMNRSVLVKILCCLLISNTSSDNNEDDELTEDELGTVAEDLSEYSWQAGLR